MQEKSQSIYYLDADFALGRVTFIPFLIAPNPVAPDATYIPASSPISTPTQSPEKTSSGRELQQA